MAGDQVQLKVNLNQNGKLYLLFLNILDTNQMVQVVYIINFNFIWNTLYIFLPNIQFFHNVPKYYYPTFIKEMNDQQIKDFSNALNNKIRRVKLTMAKLQIDSERYKNYKLNLSNYNQSFEDNRILQH